MQSDSANNQLSCGNQVRRLSPSSQHASGLSRLKPWETILCALSAGFMLFLSLDLLQAVIFGDHAITAARLLGFMRGFIAMAVGMVFVWIIMNRKETELLLLRDQHAEKAETIALEKQSVLLDLLAVINHRVSTPVLANALAAKLMAEGAFGPLESKQAEVLKHMAEENESVARLLGMLADIYSYKINKKSLSLSECRIDKIVADCASEATARASSAAKAISLDLEPATIEADSEEMTKLVRHLIDNAVKYARQKIEVRVGTHARGKAFVTVSDDGAGIAQPDIASLFDRFYQRSSDGKYAAMTGVGLCLCGEIVKAHGGTITCESGLNQGAQFIVEIPPPATLRSIP